VGNLGAIIDPRLSKAQVSFDVHGSKFEVSPVNTGGVARPGGLEPPTLGLEGEIAELKDE
jgi:hypothetical protein